VPPILTGVASIALLTLGFNMIVPLSSTVDTILRSGRHHLCNAVYRTDRERGAERQPAWRGRLKRSFLARPANQRSRS
jgi:hypothetical protein